MKAKDTLTLIQLNKLPEKNPKLWSVLLWLDARLADRPEDLVVTSIYRDTLDRNGIHGAWRAADVRIRDWAPGLPENMVEDLNNCFQYGLKNNLRQGATAHLRLPAEGQDDTASHIHIQTKGYGPWK